MSVELTFENFLPGAFLLIYKMLICSAPIVSHTHTHTHTHMMCMIQQWIRDDVGEVLIIHTHAHTHTYTHERTRMSAHARTHTQIHTHSHTHTHQYT